VGLSVVVGFHREIFTNLVAIGSLKLVGVDIVSKAWTSTRVEKDILAIDQYNKYCKIAKGPGPYLEVLDAKVIFEK
jgi:hypothetical protein